MSMISVKTKAGRVAFDAPRGGNQIPNDKFVMVTETNWVRRLIDVHGDLEVENVGKKEAAPVAKETAVAASEAKAK